MNFCGSNYEQQVQDTKLPDTTAFHCGPCVKGEGDHLDSVFSDDIVDASHLEIESRHDEAVKIPLDIIEEKLARDIERHDRAFDNRDPSPVVTIHESPPIRSLMSNASSTTATTAYTAASSQIKMRVSAIIPSPVTIPTGWGSRPSRYQSELDAPPSYQLDEIRQSASGSIDDILRRLEQGFFVKLLSGSRKRAEKVLLYLDARRHRLCLRGDQDETSEDVINFWQELPIAKILRLEIDHRSRRTKNPLRMFSLVIDSEEFSGQATYYDFEAESSIERELIVATLMVVLENAHGSLHKSGSETEADLYEEVSFVDGGTLDQPIACSPSLEDQINITGATGQYTPRHTTELHDGPFGSTEASLVINLEHLDDSAALTPKMETLRRRATSQNDMHGGPILPGVTEDLLTECKGSSQLANPWCADDFCTLALRDIADTCAGIFVLKQAETTMCAIHEISEEQRTMIEGYIASALGAPSAMFSYFSDTDVWNSQMQDQLGVVPSEHTKSLEGKIRNRAGILNAQCDRLRNLRQEMTFAAALKASKEHTALQTTQSFDDAKMLKTKRLEKEAADRLHSSPLLQHVIGNMMLSSGLEKEPEEENDIAYYDSDPEDTRCKTLKDPRQATSECRSRREKAIPERPVRALSGPGFDMIKGSSKRVSRKLDEETIVQIVQQMTNERLTLIWHPTQGKTQPNRAPICVKLWIESGVCLIDGTFLLPKLSWTKYETRASSSRHIEQTEPQKLDLLDVCRIHTAEAIDRRLHPFAVARRSFLIETQSEAFMFEAQTPEECDRIVFGLKLVIARLASLLMLRDSRAAEEFFGAVSSGVPGEAPEWARGESKPSVNTTPVTH